MYCMSCGAQINEGENFCPKCGTPVPVKYSTPYNTNYAPFVPEVNSTPVLVFGILALAFACSFWLSFLGIVFGIISKSKVSSFIAEGGIVEGKARVGQTLGKVGFILGIVMTACFFVYIIAIAAATAMYF